MLWVIAATALAVLIAVLFLVKPAIQDARYPMEYSNEVTRWAGEFEVDELLIYAVIRTESGFDPKAESSAGARGLMQMTEATFDYIKQRIAPEEELNFEDLYDPDTSIRFGGCLLSLCLARYGQDVSTAAAAYHSGWGTVDRLLQNAEHSDDGVTLKQFPYPQMGHYVNKITSSYQKYLELYRV